MFVGAASLSAARPDVGAVFGSQFDASGWTLTASGLPPGPYRLIAYARSLVTGTFNLHQAVDITAQDAVPAPAMRLDAPAAGATLGSSVLVTGWAVDAGAPSGTGVDAVHVYAFPIVDGVVGAPAFLGDATRGIARPDVGAVFGDALGASGFSLQATGLAPGGYLIVAYAHSTVTSSFNQSAVADVTVASGAVAQPYMAIDGPAASSTTAQPFLVTGWALDFGATSGTGVDAIHVWALRVSDGAPTFLGAASYGASRSDIAAIFGSAFTSTGYSLSAAGLAAGTYDVVVFMHSTVTGTFSHARTVRVTVE
jgi:hypothetical protein